jgi:cytochrome d ubiquinol oxidase subunit II
MVLFWVALLAASIIIYLLLDGFDLGVGMLFGLAGSEADRDTMLDTVAPVWDGNETWLVVAGVILWGAFPLVYATLLSAFYLPVIIMLLGLILRGVAFEFRHRATRSFRWIWDVSFVGGSIAASFMQGVTVGALVQGLCRRRIRLAELVLRAVRHRAVSWLCPSGSHLAGSKVPFWGP